MKAAIIGLSGRHYDLYAVWANFLHNHGYDLDIYTSSLSRDEITANLASTAKVNYIITDKKRNFSFLWKFRKQIKQADIAFFDAPYQMDEYFFMTFPLKTRIFMAIHNANQWFHPSFRWNLSFFRNILQYIILKRKIEGFIVVNPVMKEFIQTTTAFRNIYFVPYSMPVKEYPPKPSSLDEIRILVPGLIVEKRRDYNSLLDAFEKALNIHSLNNLKLVLLGKPVGDYGTSIIDRCKKINTQYGDSILYWNKFIPTEEFDKEIINADFILSNLNVDINTGWGNMEKYGLTKESGITYVMIKYNKPLISPADYKMIPEFHSRLVEFSQYEELVAIFKDISSGKISPENLLKEKSFDIFVEKVKNEFNQLLRKK